MFVLLTYGMGFAHGSPILYVLVFRIHILHLCTHLYDMVSERNTCFWQTFTKMNKMMEMKIYHVAQIYSVVQNDK